MAGGVTRIGEVSGDEPLPAGVTRIGDAEPPALSDVLGAAVQQPGLGFISMTGGLMEGIGDLIHSNTLAETGAEIARNARGAGADITPPGQTLGQEVLSGGVTSAMQMVPALALSGPAIATAGIGLAAANQAGSRYAELRDAGFSPGRSAIHAGFEGFAEGLGEAVSLPVLATGKPFVNKFVEFLAKDMFGEELTTALEQGSAMLSDNPSMTWGDFLKGMEMTALVTPIAAGGQIGAAAGIEGLKGFASPRTATPAPETPAEPAPALPAPTPETLPQTPAAPSAPTEPTDTDTAATPPESPAPDGLPTSEFPPKEEHPYQSAIDAMLAAVPSLQSHQDSTAKVPVFHDKASGIQVSIDPYGMVGVYAPDEVTREPYAIGKYQPHDLVEAVAAIQKAIQTYTPAAPVPAPKPPPASTLPSMLQMTPDEMRQVGHIDPLLYNGITDKVEIRQVGADLYTVRYDGGGPSVVTTVPRKDIQHIMENFTGIRLSALSKDQLDQMYRASVLNWVTSRPTDPTQISDTVNDYFGGQLRDIASQGRQRQEQLGPIVEGATEPIIGIREPYFGAYSPPAKVRNVRGQAFETATGAQADKLAPGAYLAEELHTSTNSAVAKKAQAYLERLIHAYNPNARILLGEMTAGRVPAGFVRGGTHKAGKDLYVIKLDDLLAPRAGIEGELLFSLAHEFGHTVLFSEFAKAPAAVQAKIYSSWLRYTSAVHSDSSLLQYLSTHHLHGRGLKSTRLVRDVNNAQYFMSLSEYLADQAAAHFLWGAQHTTFDPEVRGWVSKLLKTLRDLWQKLGIVAQKNHTFVSWLEDLAQSNKKPSDAGPKPPKGQPGPTAASIKAQPPKKPTTIESQEQATALIQKMTKLFDELTAAGATREEMEAINPTGLIKDFDWSAAYALADKYGIHPRWYGGKTFPGTVDDTKALRESYAELRRRLGPGDPDSVRALASGNEAIKNFNWFLQRTMTAVQLRKKFGALVPGVKTFVDNLEKMFSYRSRWKQIADDRVKAMKETPKAERDKVFEAILDEDRTGEYLSAITRNAAGQRIFTLKEEAIKKYGLTEKGIALYQGMRQDFDSALEEMEARALEELDRLYSPGPGLTKAIAELQASFNELRAKPYVPHTRFGDYTVTVRVNGRVQEFYQLESELDAKRLEQTLRKENAGKTDTAVSRGVMTDQFRAMMGLPPQLIQAMKGSLGLNEEQIGKFEDLLKDMSNGASFVRRFKRRKNIAGWADDVDQLPRAYADYMSRFANHVSRLRYNHLLSAAVSDVRSQAIADAQSGVNTTELNQLSNWLGRLQDYVNNPGEEYSNLRAAATMWYLGLNVKSALVNSTSVPMVTVPYLSKRFGWTRSFAAVTQAYRDIARMYGRGKALSDDEHKMLESLRTAGRIDQSFASELAGLREGGRLSDQTALSKPAAAFFGLKYYGMWLFQKVEVVNREVTALAAYRMMRMNKDFNPDDPQGFDKKAAEFASNAVQDTQNENAQWNRAEFMRNRKSVLTMFMSYQQNIIYQMFGGDQSWLRLLGAQMAMAGLMGLPFAQDLDELIKWFNRQVFGSDMNVEKAIRAMLKDVGVQADWFIRGASHNVFGLDLQGSLSQGRIIPGIDALTMEGNFADKIANASSDIGGAGFSIIMDMMKALSSDDPDLVRRFSRSIPQFAQGISQGADMLMTGKAQDLQGADLASVSPEEAVARGLGFQVASVTGERRKRFAQRDTAAFWLTRRQYVLAEYNLFTQTRDPTWLSKANEALRSYNDEAPDPALRISAKEIRDSIKRRATNRARASGGEATSRNQTGLYRRVGELYD